MTGVQTCALPISALRKAQPGVNIVVIVHDDVEERVPDSHHAEPFGFGLRSETDGSGGGHDEAP